MMEVTTIHINNAGKNVTPDDHTQQMQKHKNRNKQMCLLTMADSSTGSSRWPTMAVPVMEAEWDTVYWMRSGPAIWSILLAGTPVQVG